jgi:hypothetical protein
MTIRKSDGRHLVQLTLTPDLYLELKEHCRRLDTPITVWARNLIRNEMAKEAPPTPPDPIASAPETA